MILVQIFHSDKLYISDTSVKFVAKLIGAEQNSAPFRRRYFQMHFVKWKCLNFV